MKERGFRAICRVKIEKGSALICAEPVFLRFLDKTKLC